MDAADLRVRLADALAEAHRATGDGRFARARGALLGRLGGRPPVDDADAVAQAEALLADGTARNRTHAAQLVAKTLSPTTTVERHTRRLLAAMKQARMRNR